MGGAHDVAPNQVTRLNLIPFLMEPVMARVKHESEKLSLKEKLSRLSVRMRDPEWRRYGLTLASGKLLGLVLVDSHIGAEF